MNTFIQLARPHGYRIYVVDTQISFTVLAIMTRCHRWLTVGINIAMAHIKFTVTETISWSIFLNVDGHVEKGGQLRFVVFNTDNTVTACSVDSIEKEVFKK